MNSEQDDFQQLRRLLVLKRHEQPPPGYFDRFSAQIMARLRAGERARASSLFEALSWDVPWLQRLLGSLQNRPLVAGGFGFAVCGLLIAGLLFSENPNNASEFSASQLTATASLPQMQLHAGAVPNAFLERVSVSPAMASGAVAPFQPNNSLFQQLKEVQGPRRAVLINALAPGNLNQ